MSLHLVTLCLALVSDEPIPAEKAAVVTREQQKAQADVGAKYGNKKSSELSPDERRQMVKDQSAADKAVLDKNGVDAKQWARESMKKDRAGYAEQKALVKDLADKEKKAADEAAKNGKKPARDIQVQKGFSDENPVTLEEKEVEGGAVAVEKGLPSETNQDQEAASEQDRLEKGAGASDDSPRAAPKSSKGGRGR